MAKKRKRVVKSSKKSRALLLLAKRNPNWRFHPDTGEKLLRTGESLNEFQSRMRND